MPSPTVRANNARVDGPERLTGWLSGLGLGRIEVTVERFDVPLTRELAWSFVTGSGTVAMLAGLTPDAVDRVQARFLATLHERGTETLRVAATVGCGYRCGE
jgi:hypothetical protein